MFLPRPACAIWLRDENNPRSMLAASGAISAGAQPISPSPIGPSMSVVQMAREPTMAELALRSSRCQLGHVIPYLIYAAYIRARAGRADHSMPPSRTWRAHRTIPELVCTRPLAGHGHARTHSLTFLTRSIPSLFRSELASASSQVHFR